MWICGISHDHDLWKNTGHCKSNIRHNGVNDHGLEDLSTNFWVPQRNVISELTWLYVSSYELWAVLSHVSVNKKEYKTCIQELGNEHTIGNLREHFRLRVIANGWDQFDDEGLEDKIESNNDEWYQVSKHLWCNLVREINLAECYLLFTQRIHLCLFCLALMSTEALHHLSVHGLSAHFL